MTNLLVQAECHRGSILSQRRSSEALIYGGRRIVLREIKAPVNVEFHEAVKDSLVHVQRQVLYEDVLQLLANFTDLHLYIVHLPFRVLATRVH